MTTRPGPPVPGLPAALGDCPQDSLAIVMFAYETVLDRRILQEADSLAGRGHDVRIATPGGSWHAAPGGRAVPDMAVQAAGDLADDTPPPRSLPHKLMRAGLRAVTSLGFDPTRLKATARRLAGPVGYYYLPLFAEAIRTSRADLWIGHDLPMLPVALAAAARHGGPVVYDAHELWPEQEMPAADSRYWSRVERRAIGRAAAVFTVNPSIAAEMACRYGVAMPMVLRNCDRYRPEVTPGLLHARLGLAPETPVALFQGRLEPMAQLETAIETWRLLGDLPLHLAIVGNGSLAGPLRALAQRAGLEGRVHFHPHVPREELPRMTAGAAMGLILYQSSCLNTYYCTPNKLFEYLAAKVPVVATGLPEIRRIIETYGVGAVGPTDTPDALAALIRGFFPEVTASLALRGRLAAAGAALDWDNEARGFVETVERLARAGRPAAPGVPRGDAAWHGPPSGGGAARQPRHGRAVGPEAAVQRQQRAGL